MGDFLGKEGPAKRLPRVFRFKRKGKPILQAI